MTVELKLRPELDVQLRGLAEANGLTIEEYLATLIEDSLPKGRPDTALALLEAWKEEDATDDPEELERREIEWTAFKDALNEGHSSDRILFP